jgi:CPA2 family monovalent cation:H+ antiporter-2
VFVELGAAITVLALLAPLRDLFAALFFFFFALRLDPHDLVPVLLPATALAAVSGLTKVAAGWLAATRESKSSKAPLRAGLVLIPRGEFSIVIAGLAVAMPNVGTVAAAYVLITAMAGPLAIRILSRRVA